jgi:alanine-glyoxylate transaminase/serine-glyoxylate transaminase/serine-pyruvate transaminase
MTAQAAGGRERDRFGSLPPTGRFRPGRHFLQIPGPTNVPDRVLAAIAKATVDHRGPEFAQLLAQILPALRRVFRTEHEVAVFSGSGTGAWEAALVNTLSPGDHLVSLENGHFATLWGDLAARHGLEVERIRGDWRRAPDPARLHELLSADRAQSIRAVTLVHNETSTGVTSSVVDIRRAIDAAAHPALLFVDVISSLGSIDYRHDEWGVDVAVACSQKGLMLPPGLSFNAIGPRALAASASARLSRSYWDWSAILESNRAFAFPSTPATNLLYGLSEALSMLEEETLDAVFRRHARHAEATRRAVRAWGLDVYALEEIERSNTLTTVQLPAGHDADDLRKSILERFDMSLGGGLGQLRGRVFRIGHLGDLNDLTIAGVLCGVEMGLRVAGIPHERNGVAAALEHLSSSSTPSAGGEGGF